MKKKYLFSLILLGILTILVCPNVKAQTTGYVTLEEVTNNDVAVTEAYEAGGSIIEFYLSESNKSTFKLLGHDLASTVANDYSMIGLEFTTPSGFSSNSTSFDTINDVDGYNFYHEVEENAYNMYFPYFTLTLTHTSDSSPIKIRYNNTEYDGLRIYYVDPDVFVLFDEAFEELAPNGKLEINTIKPSFMYSDSMITAGLSNYNTDDYSLMGWCEDEELTQCVIQFYSTQYEQIYKSYDITYIFKQENKTVKSKVEKYIQDFTTFAQNNDNPMGVIFRLEDLENINYLYTFLKHPTTSMDEVNAVVRFSSQIKKLLGNSNIGITFDMRMGEDATLFSSAFGFMPISYDGIVYGVAENMGYERVNAIYVPDNTELSRAALIAAAKERVQAYLKDAEISIAYKAPFDTLEDYELEYIDVDKTNEEYFTLTIDGEDYDFFIVRDSSKMQNPEMTTVDVLTNVKINSNSFEIPLDTNIEVRKLDKNSDEYKNLIKKLNITDGESFDLKLFSDTADMYISELANGKFKVYIPLSDEYKGKTLIAYYLKDDGTIEKYNVSVENGFAVFETDHFSTYTLAAVGNSNPATYDGIMLYVSLLIISALVITGLVICVIKKKIIKKEH